MSWPTVPQVEDGTTALNANGLGAITDALTARTNELLSLCGQKSNNAVIITDTGMSGLTRGTVVYYNTAAQCYAEAAPESSTEDGYILPDASAYIAGILLSNPDSSGIGQLLVSGVVPGSSLGLTLTPGPYFLGDNGSLVSTPPAGKLAIYCGYLTTTGWFIFNPGAPPTKLTDQTVAAPLASIITSGGISGGMISGTRTAVLSLDVAGGTVSTSGGQAVGGISGGTFSMVPVVNTLTAGPGTDVSTTSGAVVVSATGLSPYIDFQTVNANNALIGGNVNDSLITFPVNVNASVVGTARLPHALPNGAEVFVWVSGTAEQLNVSGSVLYNSSGTLTSGSINTSVEGGSSGGITELVTSGAITSSGYADGLVKVVVFPNSAPSTAIQVVAMGIKVN